MYKVTFFGDTLTLTELIGEDKIDPLWKLVRWGELDFCARWA